MRRVEFKVMCNSHDGKEITIGTFCEYVDAEYFVMEETEERELFIKKVFVKIETPTAEKLS